MSSSAHDSASTSATTSTTEPLATETESEFLDRQVREARAAMKHVLSDIKRTLGSSVSVREWTAHYPWMATGSALAAGVAAGYLLTPRDRDEFHEMWEKLKEHLHREKEAAEAKPKSDGHGQAKQSIWRTLVVEGVKNVLPIISGLAASAMGAASQTPPDPQ